MFDTQQVATLAPKATVNFYLAYNASDCFVYYWNTCATPPPAPATPDTAGNYGAPQIGIVEADAEIQQAIGENAADVISISSTAANRKTSDFPSTRTALDSNQPNLRRLQRRALRYSFRPATAVPRSVCPAKRMKRRSA